MKKLKKLVLISTIFTLSSAGFALAMELPTDMPTQPTFSSNSNSNNSEALPNKKKRKRNCFGFCPDASSDSGDEIKIRLKRRKHIIFKQFILLNKAAATSKEKVPYFNNKAFDVMTAKRNNGIFFEDFSDSVVQLVLSIINKQLDFDQTKQAFITDLENNQDINAEEVWYFAVFLGYEKILQILAPILAEHYCSQEFFDQYYTENYFDAFPGKELIIHAMSQFLKHHKHKIFDNNSGITITYSWPLIIYSVVFSPDGKLLATDSFNNNAKIWNVNSGQCIHTLTGHIHPITSVAFSPDGKLLATGSWDGTAKIWDLNWFKNLSIEQLILIIRLQNCKNRNEIITLNSAWQKIFNSLSQEDKIDAGINDIQVSLSTHVN